MVVHGATTAMDAWVPGNGVLGGGQGMAWLVGR
jgi:hypothetical protein